MSDLTLTQQIIIAIIVLSFAIDAWLLAKYGVKGTISYVLAQWSQQYIVIPFLIGFIMGHLFWENCG